MSNVFSMKFSEAPKQEPLDEGTEYTLTIAGTTVKPSKDGASVNLNIEFDVVGEPGRKVWKLFNNKPQALWASRAFFNALAGYEKYGEDDDVDLDEDELNELVGQQIGATMTTETNPENGKERSVPGNWFNLNAEPF